MPPAAAEAEPGARDAVVVVVVADPAVVEPVVRVAVMVVADPVVTEAAVTARVAVIVGVVVAPLPVATLAMPPARVGEEMTVAVTVGRGAAVEVGPVSTLHAARIAAPAVAAAPATNRRRVTMPAVAW